MDLNKIKEIINLDCGNNIKEELILREIALNENALKDILTIIISERELKKDLIGSLNSILSQSYDIFSILKQNKIGKKDWKYIPMMKTRIINFYKCCKDYLRPASNINIDYFDYNYDDHQGQMPRFSEFDIKNKIIK